MTEKVLAEKDIGPLLRAILRTIPDIKENSSVRSCIKSKLNSISYCAPGMIGEHYESAVDRIVQYSDATSDWWPKVDSLLKGNTHWSSTLPGTYDSVEEMMSAVTDYVDYQNSNIRSGFKVEIYHGRGVHEFIYENKESEALTKVSFLKKQLQEAEQNLEQERAKKAKH